MVGIFCLIVQFKTSLVNYSLFIIEKMYEMIIETPIHEFY